MCIYMCVYLSLSVYSYILCIFIAVSFSPFLSSISHLCFPIFIAVCLISFPLSPSLSLFLETSLVCLSQSSHFPPDWSLILVAQVLRREGETWDFVLCVWVFVRFAIAILCSIAWPYSYILCFPVSFPSFSCDVSVSLKHNVTSKY